MTGVAIGVARVIGVDLMRNFDQPHGSRSMTEWWTRWHISLSFWIRDYLLVPLLGAGSRLTTFRFIWATILTFAIVGFWHGPSWNFILFGLWHGSWLTFYTLLIRNLPASASRITNTSTCISCSV